MLFKKYFKKFDFYGFINFVHDLFNKGLGEIRFYPSEHKELFSKTQLVHIAPNWDINDPNGFVWAWRQKQTEVKKVSFELFNKDGKGKISMTINLDGKFISLDEVEKISAVEVEEILKKNLDIFIDKKWYQKLINIFEKYIPKVIVGLIILIVGTFIVFSLGWNK